MRTETIKLRVDPDEKQAFQDAADLAGISLSGWVRERLRTAAIRDLENARQPIPFVKQIPIGSIKNG